MSGTSFFILDAIIGATVGLAFPSLRLFSFQFYFPKDVRLPLTRIWWKPPLKPENPAKVAMDDMMRGCLLQVCFFLSQPWPLKTLIDLVKLSSKEVKSTKLSRGFIGKGYVSPFRFPIDDLVNLPAYPESSPVPHP